MCISFLKETISTCRFSQRVALIKNDAILNEELDPRVLINQLRVENLQLRNQLSMQNGDEQFTESLTKELIEKYLNLVYKISINPAIFHLDYLNK